MGGFGRFQFISTIALTIVRNSGMYIYYGFGYLTLEQTYMCRSDSRSTFEQCTMQ